jgi:hypothetical protein
MAFAIVAPNWLKYYWRTTDRTRDRRVDFDLEEEAVISPSSLLLRISADSRTPMGCADYTRAS